MFKKLMATTLVGTILMLGACSTSSTTGGVPTPVVTPIVIPVSPNTVAAIINLASAFGGFKGQLTPEQLAAMQTYLSSTKNPDVLIIAQMLVADGVIPTGSKLTPTEIAAMLGLLDTLGFSPVLGGSAPTAAQLAPERTMRYAH